MGVWNLLDTRRDHDDPWARTIGRAHRAGWGCGTVVGAAIARTSRDPPANPRFGGTTGPCAQRFCQGNSVL